MSFPSHLLEQARHLAHRERKRPRQASLRRSVSTAYYALFHHLINEATLNWKRIEQRPLLARFFEHGKMKNACERQRGECVRFMNSNPPPPHDAEFEVMNDLHWVSNAFVQSQQQRHSADYDSSKVWTRTEVLTLIQLVAEAFESWKRIREDNRAQAFLISLLGNPKG